MNRFNIEKYTITDKKNIDVSNVPMLVRRKLSKLDKLAYTVLSNIYQKEVTNIIFSSKNGEFERLKEIIAQYKLEDLISPTKFSSSVHNFSVSSFSQLNKITIPYTALSAGDESLSAAIITGISKPNTKTCICYADNIGIGLILSTSNDGFTFSKSNEKPDTIDDFVDFLKGEKDRWNMEYGIMNRI